MNAPVLVIDTTGPWCACALETDGRVLLRAEEIGRGHAEALAPMARALLGEAALEPRALWRIGVNTGPGGFAGTRVGTAFARGLSLACGAQAVGVDGLAALARRADPEGRRTVIAVHDARRGELVWRVFEAGQAGGEAAAGGVEDARAALERHPGALLAGSGAALLGGPVFDPEPPLEDLLALARAAPADAPPPAPFYVRAPDAKPAGGGP